MGKAGPTDANLTRVLWLSLAATFPFFGVPFARNKIGLLEIPIPIYSMGAIVAAGILALLMRHGRIRKESLVKRYQGVGVLCFLFFLWHLTSLFLFEENTFGWALKEMVKIGTGLVWFWGILALFPRDERFLKRFWSVVLWSTVLLLMYLSYNSLIKGSRVLSVNLEDVTQIYGTNQLGFYLSIIAPYVFFYFWGTRQKLKALIPLLVIFFGLVYVAIRAAWLSVTVALLFTSVLVWKKDRARAVKLLTSIIVSGMVIILGGMFFSSMYAVQTLAVDKFNWIFDAETVVRSADPAFYEGVPRFDTQQVRWEKVERAWNIFTESPIMGVGLENLDFDTHNDYTRILAELGVVGELLFLGILAFIYRRLLHRPAIFRSVSWVSLATRGAAVAMAISLNFVTTYTAPHFWVFLGLFVVAIETERQTSQLLQQCSVSLARRLTYPGLCGKGADLKE